MVDTAIDVSGIGKRLRIGAKQESYKTLRELIVQLASAPFRLGSAARGRAAQDNQFWALQDISFKVARGEVVGVIGRNGAGKSTLLKILSRITEPTTGKALLRGRVASMLEVGTGFHPELTGRENIYLNGAVIGMKREEIKRKFDEIVAFSEVEKFVDTPVKHYSSGMYLRLAFAVSAHLEHEILLIDEVLAVGDAEFQKKCIGKIGDVAKAGRTILFVSHNMGAVENLCKTSLVLDAGRLAYYGDTKDAIAQYLSRSASLEEQQKLTGAQRRPGQGRVRFERVWAEQDGHCTTTLTSGGDVDIIIEYKVHKPEPIKSVTVGIVWRDHVGGLLLSCTNRCVGFSIRELPEDGRIICRIPKLPLNEGTYRLGLQMIANLGLEDTVEFAIELGVQAGDYFGTGNTMPRNWGPLLIPHSFALDAPSMAESGAKRCMNA